MPCSDSSSSISITISKEDCFVTFDFAKITCGREISAETGYSQYCVGRPLVEILKISYADIARDLKLKTEEELFILYLEWDALRSALAQYLGIYSEDIDQNRCIITSIEHREKEIELSQVILPPQELPKIIPCGMVDN